MVEHGSVAVGCEVDSETCGYGLRALPMLDNIHN
jgi:hypothetical protein